MSQQVQINTVIMKGGGVRKNFSSTPAIRYRNPALSGREYTLISYGRCNFRCAFCFTAGDESDKFGNFPDAKLIAFEDLKKIVAAEVKRGMVIRISGGEPGLYPKETIELLKLIKDLNGFSVVDSNGTNFTAILEFSKFADIVSVDPIKAPKEIVAKLTGVGETLAWDRGVETTKKLGELHCQVEFKTMLFDPIDMNHLEFIYSILPKSVWWTLKRYLPAKHYFPADNNAEMTRVEFNNGLNQPSKEAVMETGKILASKHPDLAGRLMCVVGSTRKKENYVVF